MRAADPVRIAVASRDIQTGEVIDDAMVMESDVPRKFAQPGAISSTEVAAGRVASIPIRSGSHLTAANARRISESRGVSGVIPPGKRAVSIILDDASGTAGLVMPNDVVDVMATFDLGSDASAKRTTVTVAEGMYVLAVGSEVADFQMQPEVTRTQSGSIFGGESPSISPRHQAIITLAATPYEAQALTFAKESATLGVSIRAKGDEDAGERVPPTTIATITGGHDELAPMKRGFREYRGR